MHILSSFMGSLSYLKVLMLVNTVGLVQLLSNGVTQINFTFIAQFSFSLHNWMKTLLNSYMLPTATMKQTQHAQLNINH